MKLSARNLTKRRKGSLRRKILSMKKNTLVTTQYNSLLNFFTEAGLLKRVKRSGWWVVGIKEAESVAEHSFRTAIVAYALAKMEGVSPYEAVMMALFNDIHEARINDLHKMGQRYIDFTKAEKSAFLEQMLPLPRAIKEELTNLHQGYFKQKSRPAIIARDADILECLIQAKEYQCQGYISAKEFFKKAPGFLKTKSAKALWKAVKTWDINDWWIKLTTFVR